METVQDIFQEGKSLLKTVPSSALETRLLLCKSMDISEKQFYSDPDMLLLPQQKKYFLRLVAKRLSGYPLAHLLETQEFWSLSFQVDSGVLIPRPETELIIETVLEASSGKKEIIVDLGTGCGNIAVALAQELPKARITATDTSPKALKLAQVNAIRHNVSHISFLKGSMFSPLRTHGLENSCHFLLSNPPYVSRSDWEKLPPEIREHEPQQALVAGETGLEFIHKLIHGAGKFLLTGGFLIFEIGYDQKTAVMELFGDEWHQIECFNDLSGIPRVFVAKKS